MGHHLYKPDGNLFCGCGSKGHLEPYLSARGAESLAKQYFQITNQRKHPILEKREKREKSKENLISKITAKDIYYAYKLFPNQEPQKSIKEIQTKAITYSFGLITSMWNPVDIIICMGGQTKDKDILFYQKDGAIERYNKNYSQIQLRSLNKPKITITEREEIGVRGAVAYYLSKQ